jgi:hypothetical protein
MKAYKFVVANIAPGEMKKSPDWVKKANFINWSRALTYTAFLFISCHTTTCRCLYPWRSCIQPNARGAEGHRPTCRPRTSLHGWRHLPASICIVYPIVKGVYLITVWRRSSWRRVHEIPCSKEARVIGNHWPICLNSDAYENPKGFNPDWWIDHQDLPPLATFGLGRRRCIGKSQVGCRLQGPHCRPRRWQKSNASILPTTPYFIQCLKVTLGLWHCTCLWETGWLEDQVQGRFCGLSARS